MNSFEGRLDDYRVSNFEFESFGDVRKPERTTNEKPITFREVALMVLQPRFARLKAELIESCAPRSMQRSVVSRHLAAIERQLFPDGPDTAKS